MMTMEQALAFRAKIEAAAGYLPDEKAASSVELFPAWSGGGAAYAVGDRVRHGELYKCLTAHTSQADWMPGAAPSLWVRIDDPAVEWPEWRRPQGSTDAYPLGAKVIHSGKHWTSDVDSNSWEPGVYGWTEHTPETV